MFAIRMEIHKDSFIKLSSKTFKKSNGFNEFRVCFLKNMNMNINIDGHQNINPVGIFVSQQTTTKALVS